MTVRGLRCAALAAVLALAGCSTSGSDRASSIVIASAPSPYALQSGASGPLDTPDGAAPLLPTTPSDTSAALTANHYSGGYVRVFTAGSSFLTVIALEFASAADASAFAAFETRELDNLQTVYMVSEPAIPGATLDEIAGGTRANGAALSFCDGVTWSSGSVYVDAVNCAPPPVSPALAEAVAAQVYRNQGGTPASPSP